MQATVISGDHSGKTVEIETIEENASKVRICKGFDGAGQVLWMNNSDIDWESPTQKSSWLPKFPIDWVKYIVAGVVIVAIAIKLFLYIPGALQDSRIRQLTNELNQINSLDATDVEIRNQAQGRIDSRAERKNEILKQINFKGADL